VVSLFALYADRIVDYVDCPRCLAIDVPETTKITLLAGASLVQRATLSYWLRHQEQSGRPIVLTDDLVKKVFRDERLPAPDEQATAIVRAVGNHFETSHEELHVDLKHFASEIGALDERMVRRLIVALLRNNTLDSSTRNLVAIEHGEVRGMHVGLGSEGWKKYRDLQQGRQEPMTRHAIGSPYGFTSHDWRMVEDRRRDRDTLRVVFGLQFKSRHYERGRLEAEIRQMFHRAVQTYNDMNTAKLKLNFRALAAGYGEHLFNEIARDIISADIAVFDTSDLNPNVALEMGVALTWGVSVFPVKCKGRPKPPSDVSGQTWADYVDSASCWTDPDHAEKLVELVARATAKNK